MHAIIKNRLLVVTYLLTILYALHYGIPLYVSSSYLHQYWSEASVSLIYMVGSFAALLASMSFARYMRRLHTYRFTVTILVMEMVALFGVGLSGNPYLIGFFYICHFILQTLLYIALNVFVESFSKHAETGSIRGIFLTLLNIGILISPMIAGSILSVSSFTVLYTISGCMLIPFAFLVHNYFQHIEEPVYDRLDLARALKIAWAHKGVRGALVAEFIVQCFYAVMIIYSPLYLATLGISLPVYLSAILPFALVPLVVLPYELGYLADTKLGEKEMLILGMLILAVSTFLCVIITAPSITLWLLIFLIGRTGAAFMETMSFTYYYKKVNPGDASLTALFSNAASFATIVVGALGLALGPLLVSHPQMMFIVLGIAILWSVSYVLPMRDTK